MSNGAEVDRWFAERSHPLESTMQRVREIILQTDGRITESIKWKTPTFAFHGNIASFNPAKNFVSLMFHRGAELPGIHPRLEGDSPLVRTMRFSSLDEVNAAANDIRAAVAAWISLKTTTAQERKKSDSS